MASKLALSGHVSVEQESRGWVGLTAREAEVLVLVVVNRYNNVKIAALLYVSERTVERHMAVLLRKFAAPNRAALIRVAMMSRRPAAPPAEHQPIGGPQVWVASVLARAAEMRTTATQQRATATKQRAEAVRQAATARQRLTRARQVHSSPDESSSCRRGLHQPTRVLAHGIDPVRSLAAAARMVRGASAGAVLYRASATQLLPGLDGDALLAEGSPVIAVARACIDDGQVYLSFLWPRPDRHAPDGHVRVTVLTSPRTAPGRLLGAVILSPVTDLRRLTARELEVLGLLLDGCSNQQIARALVVAPRTVATHLEHILVKLDAPTRTLAAVRAEREGLYVPPSPTECRA